MDNVFTAAGAVSSVAHRKVESKPNASFSPSFGVHHGLIKDPNWPPASFPEQGTAAARRLRRVAAAFEVAFEGGQAAVTGDISAGGAMFLFERALNTGLVYVLVDGHVARAEVLSAHPKDGKFAHHCRFLDVDEAGAVWHAIEVR